MPLALGVHGIGRVHWASALGVHWVCIGIEGGMTTWSQKKVFVDAFSPAPVIHTRRPPR